MVSRSGKQQAFWASRGSLEPRQIDPGLLSEAKRALGLSASDIERASRPAKGKVKVKENGPER